jgi:hypothetical protein
VEFLRGPETPAERWVWISVPGQSLRKLPRDWTSLGTPDPYHVLPEPPELRLEALVELAALVVSLRKSARKGNVKGEKR